MIGQGPMSFDHELHTVTLNVHVRAARRADLAHLEWWGQFAPDRPLIRWMFRRQLRGLACMLVADVHGYSVGQAWVEYPNASTGIGGIWAVRVFPFLQNHGIGTLLIHTAETLLASREALGIEMEAHSQNHAARRLYEQLGYEMPQPDRSARLCEIPGPPVPGQILLRKLLTPSRAHGGSQSGDVA